MRAGLFPGQGVPAREVLAALPADHDLLHQASDILCYDLRKRVEQVARRERAIMPTSLAQPAIFTAGLISFFDSSSNHSSSNGGRCNAFLGHSLGEYAALVAAGSLSFAHGLCVVQVRGDAMEKVARTCNGGMVAVIDLTLDEAEALAAETGVTVANDNAPRQVVLAGDHDALAEVARRVRSRGGRAVRLDVTGPFHTAQIAPAVAALREALDHVAIRSPRVPVISNVSAAPYRAPGEIRKLLLEQVTTRVRFRESVERVARSGVTELEDFGPGHVVAGLAARTVAALAPAVTAGSR